LILKHLQPFANHQTPYTNPLDGHPLQESWWVPKTGGLPRFF
jgi:hypothetical protein